MDIHKTIYLNTGNDRNKLQINHMKETKRCDEYKYLGIIFDGTNNEKICLKIMQAKRAMSVSNEV